MFEDETRSKRAELPQIPRGIERPSDFFENLFLDERVIWMGQNTNHLGLTERFVEEAIRESLSKKEYQKYPPPEGFTELRNLILEDLSLSNTNQRVLITAGGTEALYLTMRAIVRSHDNVITSDPGYVIIDNFAKRFGESVTAVPVYSEDWGYKLDPDRIEDFITPNTRMIAIIDPLNPLGSCYTRREIRKFVEIAEEKDIWILHDITYRDFAEEHTLAAWYAPERTVTIYSFSKSYGLAGMRIGALIAPDFLIEDIKKNHLVNDLGVNVLAQRAAIGALRNKREWLDTMKEICRENQSLIKESVDEIDGAFIPVYPSSANMLVVDLVDAGVRPVDVASILLAEYRIFVRDGSYTSRRFGHRYLRISFSIPRDQVEFFSKVFPLAVEKARKML